MLQKKMFEATCSDCGQATTVPFKPTAGKPVYCRTCFEKRMPKRSEKDGLSFNFDQKHAWARRGDDWKGRNEPEPGNVFSR